MRNAQIPSQTQPLATIATPQRKQFGTRVNGLANEDDATLREALSKAQADLASMTEARNTLQNEAAKEKALLRSMEEQSIPLSAVARKGSAAGLDEAPRLRSSSFGPRGPPPGPPPSGSACQSSERDRTDAFCRPPPPLPKLPSDLPNGRSMTPDKRDSVSSTTESSTTGARSSIVSSTTTHEVYSQDPKIQRKIEDQEAQVSLTSLLSALSDYLIQVAKLTKQLGHCESDLRANIDL